VLLVIGAFVIHAVVKFTYNIHMFDINSKIETISFGNMKITSLIIYLHERVSECCLTPIPSNCCLNRVYIELHKYQLTSYEIHNFFYIAVR
jgi:hypothetical protein